MGRKYRNRPVAFETLKCRLTAYWHTARSDDALRNEASV